jgi:hypothetical protein
VQARHAGKLLPLTRFSKDDAEISQGAIVSNKLLAGALQFIKDKQAESSRQSCSAMGRGRFSLSSVSRERAKLADAALSHP